MLVKRRMEKITDRKISASNGYDPSKRVSSSSDETQNMGYIIVERRFE